MRLRMVNTNILVRPIKEVEGEIIVPDEPGIGDAIRGEVKEIEMAVFTQVWKYQ